MKTKFLIKIETGPFLNVQENLINMFQNDEIELNNRVNLCLEEITVMFFFKLNLSNFVFIFKPLYYIYYISSFKKLNEQIHFLHQQQYSGANNEKDKKIVDLNQKILNLEYIMQKKQFERSNPSTKKRTLSDDEDDNDNSDMSDNDTDHDSTSCNYSKKLKKKHNQPNSEDQYRRAYLKSSTASTHSKHKAVTLILIMLINLINLI